MPVATIDDYDNNKEIELWSFEANQQVEDLKKLQEINSRVSFEISCGEDRTALKPISPKYQNVISMHSSDQLLYKRKESPVVMYIYIFINIYYYYL